MTRVAHHLLYALAVVPGRRRLAARLGFSARPWTLAAFPFAVLVLLLTWSSWLYPLRPDAITALTHPFTPDRAFDDAWGGPTLVGAWFVHAMAALGMQVICLAVIRRLHGKVLVEAV